MTPREKLNELIGALRGDKPTWWYYGSCRTCAMEIARRLGMNIYELGMSPKAIQIIFYGFEPHDIAPGVPAKEPTSMDYALVQPHHVATALEHYRDTDVAVSPIEIVKDERIFRAGRVTLRELVNG